MTPPRCGSIPNSYPTPATWIAENRSALGDLGCVGEADMITIAFKKPKGGQLTGEQTTHNKGPQGQTCGWRAGKLTAQDDLQALRNISLRPRRIGKIVVAALVLPRTNHDRTT
jgi:hypothetical protein